MLFLKKNYVLFLILSLSFWAIKPFFIPGFFPMHDDTQVARVFEMGKMLANGVFPVRWVPDLGYGYGYPIFNFYAPLAYYIGGFFILLGFDALIATKIMMALGVILAGVFMYLLAKEFWGRVGGIVSALFYVYAPYHALDIYVRGDVAEFWAYAFIPLMFLGFYKVFKSLKLKQSEVDNSKFKIQNSKLQFKIQRFGIIGTLGFAGVILSHNLTAMMVTPFLLASFLIFIISLKKELRILTTLYLLLYTLLGLVLSAFYWIPALAEMKNTNVLSQIGGGANFRDHFICLGQLWESSWGFGGSTAGCMLDGMSFVIGKLHIIVPFIVLVLSLIPLIKNKYYNFNKNYIVAFLSFVGFVLSTFFTLGISRFVWETIPLMAFFQYPWRFLLLSSFFASFISGASIWVIIGVASNHLEGVRVKWVLGAVLIAMAFLLIGNNSKLFNPQTILNKTSEDFTNEKALKWTASKTSDEFLPPNFKKPKSEKEIAKNPIPFKETTLEKASNVASFIGVLALIIGIIVRYGTTKR